MMTARTAEQTIGWQGITLQVYDDWSVVGFGGDSHLGSMRIDSGDDSSAIAGLEIRWSEAKGKQTEQSLEARIKPLLRGIVKDAKKNSVLSEPVVKPFRDTVYSDRDVSIDFKWTAGRAGHGRIFHCGECGRIVVVQAYGNPGGEFIKRSKTVLDSVQCHSGARDYVTWGLYGLLLDVPADFELTYQQLMNVYLQLKFQRKNSTDQLMVEQWSLANVQLKGAYLDEWYELKSVGWTDGVRSEKSESAVKDHPALAVNGRRSDLAAVLVDSARQYSKLRLPALNYAGLLWECPESNKAYMIQSFTRRPEERLVRQCSESTVCHRSGDVIVKVGGQG
jgi:hypothetical protein